MKSWQENSKKMKITGLNVEVLHVRFAIYFLTLINLIHICILYLHYYVFYNYLHLKHL